MKELLEDAEVKSSSDICLELVQVLAILGVAFAVWWMNYASESIKARIEETVSPVVGALLSAWNWLLDTLIDLKDRITGARPRGGAADDAYFQPLASGDFGLDEEEARSPEPLNGH